MNAGWYPDQQDSRVERFWDGHQWTLHARPAGSPITASRPGGMSSQAKAWLIAAIAVGAAAVIAVLVLLIVRPWQDDTPIYLDNAAVASYIDRNYGVNVVCNGGADIQIEQGKVFSCRAGNGKIFSVRLTDDRGQYQVEPS